MVYWTYDRCKEEVLKYNTLYNFRVNNSGAINSIYKNKWVHLLKTLKKQRKPNNFWTYNNCKKEALKYKNRNEFCKKSNGAYNSSRKHKWLDDICQHMVIKNNNRKRCIYSYEFPDNHVYVGLTYNIEKRHNDRKNDKKDQVTKYMIKSRLYPIRKQLTDYIDVNDAIKLEGYCVDKYKNDKWIILNKSKTGAIGSELLWTYDKCQIEALKYKNKTDYKNGSSGSYSSAYINKWIDNVCQHMVTKHKPKNYWNYNKCQIEALKYKTKTEFLKKSNGAYEASRKHKWLNDICSHMVELRKPNGYWTYEKCKEEALKYKNKRIFSKNSSRAYNISLSNNWLNDMFI